MLTNQERENLTAFKRIYMQCTCEQPVSDYRYYGRLRFLRWLVQTGRCHD